MLNIKLVVITNKLYWPYRHHRHQIKRRLWHYLEIKALLVTLNPLARRALRPAAYIPCIGVCGPVKIQITDRCFSLNREDSTCPRVYFSHGEPRHGSRQLEIPPHLLRRPSELCDRVGYHKGND